MACNRKPQITVLKIMKVCFLSHIKEIQRLSAQRRDGGSEGIRDACSSSLAVHSFLAHCLIV